MDFKVKPYDWQLVAIENSDKWKDMAIFADMGTGKSGAMVNILRRRFMEAQRVRRTLILSPLVTLYNWKNEFDIHSNIPQDRIHVIHGDSKAKLKKFEKAVSHNNQCILITNYEALTSKTVLPVLQAWAPEILVLDESHMCKNHKTTRSKNALLLALKADHRYIMTGTPMTNKAHDLYMQFKILDNGETLGNSFYAFQQYYMYDENARWAHKDNHFPKWVLRPDKEEELNKKIYSKGIRVLKSECLDLPPLINEVYPVPLSRSQEKYYKQMERDLVAFLEEGKEGTAVAQTAMTKALRLMQIVTGHVKTDAGEIIEIEDNPRLHALEELISALHEQHKVIVWCSFRQDYKIIGRMLSRLKVKHVFITGDMSLDQKRESMDSFNNDTETRVVVANRRAGGIGVNLVAADYSIVYSRNFSLEEELQSNDRNYRGGSQIHEKIVRINLCATGTIDEAATRALMEKKMTSDRVLKYFRR